MIARDVYARGVVVSSQAWANALPVAEYTLAMILMSAKGVLRMRDHYREARRAKSMCRRSWKDLVRIGFESASSGRRRSVAG